ncbi:septation protein A [Sphingomonas sp. 1P06PA]|uniref:septation protein A n=1 Tax=Sphingomonas sp. 1P06PA TaxID=554121 RepID=UPI0039A5E735
MTVQAAQPAKPEPSPLLNLAVDLGPLVVFFLFNMFAPGEALQRILTATVAFMIATAAAMIVARLRFGKISPMLIVSGAMVLVFGGLTLWLHNDLFIKIKPTAYYLTVATILFFGLYTGRPTLKLVLGAVYPGLSERGWSLLSRNWAFLFLALAAANEIVWRNFSTDFWMGYKLWGAFPATILFAIANVPMLLRHGLALDPKTAAVEEAGPGQ